MPPWGDLLSQEEIADMWAVRPVALVALVLALLPAAALRAADTLTVCLDEDIPLFSVHHGKESTGFQLAVAEAVAKKIGRTLEVQWFETKIDPDDSGVLGSNALLSDGRCQLVPGYPLVRDAPGKPGMPTARLPDFDGATLADRRRRIPLGTLVPSRAHHSEPLTIVLGATTTKSITTLADLQGLRLEVEAATLGDAILMLYRDGITSIRLSISSRAAVICCRASSRASSTRRSSISAALMLGGSIIGRPSSGPPAATTASASTWGSSASRPRRR
jgi:hypothetical protein